MEAATLELAGLIPGEIVLDVGCGTGSLAISAKEQVGRKGEVHGIDASPEMIDVAHRKAGKSSKDIDFQVGLIENIKFPDDRFDVVLSSLMMHHLPGEDLKRRGLAEINRVLKPGGRLLIVDLEPPKKGILKHIMNHILGHHMMSTDIRQLPAIVESVGFTEVKVDRTSHRILSFVSGRAGKG